MEMCGIFGYAGKKEALPILLEGLARLEYRGYDSAGVALLEGDTLAVRKARGRLDNLKDLLERAPIQGATGIGHTRWATHGGPSDENAHPHTDCEGRFAVVHNGIIENHMELRAWLEREGYAFTSQTDTEVIAHLLAHFWQGDLSRTVRECVRLLRGSFAMCVLCRDLPGTICCARMDSPLVIGLGEGENFLASDIPALLPYTRDVVLLEDRELAMITRDGVACYGAYGQNVTPSIDHIGLERHSADLGGYPHYMIKEIHEQPAAMRAALDAYTSAESGRVRFRDGVIPIPLDETRRLKRIILVGCGSAYHAAAVGKGMIERIARLPVEIDIASEFRYRDPILTPEDLCVFISQSGETADTLAAMRLAQKHSRTLGIVNVAGSSLAREAGSVLYTRAGPEIAVATTKGYITQVLVLALLALYLAYAHGRLEEAAVSETLGWLSQVPSLAEGVTVSLRHIQRFASEHYDRRSVFYIGRGADYATAMEASLKLKEITYAHSEAYAAGELKHGTIALIEPGALVVALVTQPALADKMLSNIREARARGAVVLALTARSLAPRVEPEVDEVWDIPDTGAVCMPMLSIIPMQILAYYMALARGKDVDKPRNLAKSVTVE